MAVTKTHSAEAVLEAYAAGCASSAKPRAGVAGKTPVAASPF